MADNTVAIGVAVRNLQQSINDLKSLGSEGQAALGRITEAAPRASAALAGVGEAARRSSGQTAFALTNAAEQARQFVEQISFGTSATQALAQQLPQALVGFGALGAGIGLVVSVAGGLADAFLGAGKASQQAAEQAKAQAQATDGLLQKFGVSTKSADEFTASIGALTEAQRGMVAVDLAAELDKQVEALKASAAEADKAAFSVKASAVQAIAGGSPEATGGVPLAVDPAVVALSNAVELQRQLFKDSATNAMQYRDTVVAAAQANGMAAPAALDFADKLVLADLATKETQQAIDLLIAKQTLLVDPTNAAAQAIVDQAEAMKAAQAAAKGYADGMATLDAQLSAVGSKRQQFVQQALQQYHLSDADIGRLGPDQQPAALEQQTGLASKAQEVFNAKEATADREKLTAETARLNAEQGKLAAGTDKVRAAGLAAAEAERQRVTDTEGRLIPGGEKLIAQAQRQGEATARLGEQQAASGKAAGEAARQAQFAADVHAKFADAQRALTEAQTGGVVETQHAIAVRQAEAQLLAQHIGLSDRRYAQLRDELAATIELTAAAKDRYAIDKQLDDIRASGNESTFGRDASGRAFGAGDAGALNARQLQEAQQRAQAVQAQLARMPESLKNDETERAKVIDAETEAFNKQLVIKQQQAAINLAAQERDQLVYAQQRLAAEGQSLPVREQILAQLAAENDLTAKGIDLDKIRYDPDVIAAYAAAVRTHVTEAQGKDADDAKKRSQQLADEVMITPFKDLASTIGSSLTDGLNQFEQQGLPGLFTSLQTFAGSLRNVGNQFASNLLTLPLNAAMSQFQTALTAKGGSFSSALDQMAKDHPLLTGLGIGGTIGGLGGGIAAGITGNQNTATGGSLGGLAGGIGGALLGSAIPGVGTVIGGLVGSGLGTALGSAFGSFFGGSTGGKNYDAMNSVYDPRTRSFQSTDKQGSQQNAEAARALAQQGADVLDTIRALGLGDTRGSFGFRVGPQGVDLGTQHFQTQEAALQELIRQMLDDTVGTVGETLTTVLKNTQAKNAQELQQDIQFAATYDQLTNRAGTYQQSLTELQQTYGAATTEAEKLGLDTKALADAQADAQAKLRQQTILQIRTLEGTAGPLANAIANINEQFDAANKNVKALGMSEAELNAARAKAIADQKAQFGEQYRELTGQAGGFQKELFALRDRFRQARAIGTDEGYDTSGLSALQSRQEQKLRDSYIDQFEQLTGAAGAFGQTLLDLRDKFDQAREIARELGLSTVDLAQKEHDAEVRAYQDARTQLTQQLSGQGQQVRGFVDSLVNPLRQALSGFGALAGFTSPQQALQSGLADFRKTFASARNDNVAAIQGLPQEAQQLLQLARQYGGSGPQFASIFAEVQRDLKEVLDAQEARGNAIESQIPGASEQTAQQQLDAMTSGFADVVKQLQQLDADWSRLGGALPAGSPLGGAANQNAAAFAAVGGSIVAAQAQTSGLVADVAGAVRLGTDKQIDALTKGFADLGTRLASLEKAVRASQSGRLGKAA